MAVEPPPPEAWFGLHLPAVYLKVNYFVKRHTKNNGILFASRLWQIDSLFV